MSSGTLGQALRLDVRLQWRYGFFYAAAFSALVWEAIVLVVPGDLRPVFMPYFIFGDLAIVGFFFIAGAVFFERGERTLFALLVSPMRFRDYYAAKLSTLTALSLVLSLVIAVSGVGFDFNPATFLAAVALSALLFLMCSFISVTPFQSISEWIIPSTGVIALLNVPLLHYSGLWENPVTYLVPTQGVMLLLGHSFDQLSLSAWQWVYAFAYPAAWLAVLGAFSRKMFDRHIAAGEGAE